MSLISEKIIQSFSDQSESVLVALNAIQKTYMANLKTSLSHKLMDLKNLPNLPESVEHFDTSFEKDFFTISEEERQENKIETFEDAKQKFLNQAKAFVESDENLDSNFIIGIWEKICEYFC